MIGAIHVILKDVVTTKFGANNWKKIVAEFGQETDEDLMQMEHAYEDAVTFGLVEATCKVLGVTLDQALTVFGKHFVDVIHMGDHLRMMRTMGDTMGDFLDNVNHLHYALYHRFPKANFPGFNIRRDPEQPDTFLVSYSSSRGDVLHALVVGVLQQVSLRLHDQHLEMTRLEKPLQGYLVSWTAKASDVPEEKRIPQPLVGSGAKTAGGLWHGILTSAACCGEKQAQKGAKLTRSQKLTLDALQTKAFNSSEPSAILMRSVRAQHVAAEWDDLPGMHKASAFWLSKVGMPRDYLLSQDALRADRFVTHSWSPPMWWEEIMGENCPYADIKAIELWIVAMDIAQEKFDDSSRWKEITFWVDKCCIPQQHALTRQCISMIEKFIRNTDGMTVLFTWDYFERLWCVYEWASFLVWHSAAEVEVCTEMFMRPATRHHYLHAIRTFTVRSAKCFHEPDRSLLQEKIAEYYVSEAAFERFAKCTVIAVLSRSAVYRAGRSSTEMQGELDPLRELAQELNLPGLVAALQQPDPVGWRSKAMSSGTEDLPASASKGTAGSKNSREEWSHANWQKVYKDKIRDWFMSDVLPVVEMVKEECVHTSWRPSRGEVTV